MYIYIVYYIQLNKFIVAVYQCVAGDPVEVEIDSMLVKMEPIEAFPGIAELERARTHIHMRMSI